jgi:hypothetical protein
MFLKAFSIKLIMLILSAFLLASCDQTATDPATDQTASSVTNSRDSSEQQGSDEGSGSGDSSSDSSSSSSDSSNFYISEAKWDDEDHKLKVKGKGDKKQKVTVTNAANGDFIGDDKVDGDKWKVKNEDLDIPPCRVKAMQENGASDEKDVENAPSDCTTGDTGGGNTGGGNTGGGTATNGNFTILAANDLGMHCADQDYRIFSILPPYNVLNAQVLQKGAEPKMMSPADGIRVTYKAAESNYFQDFNDPNRLPDLTNSLTTTGQNLPSVFKNNFWKVTTPSVTGIDKIGFKAYESLYPDGVLAMFPSSPDLGLPAPEVEELYLGGGSLLAEQSAMPGQDNTPQEFNNYIKDFPFFVKFPFGYTVKNFERYTAEGIPVSPIDDAGNSNPYPLMRVEARDSADNVLASVDAVVPVASEADCAICHTTQEVCDIDNTNSLACDDIANANYPNANFPAVRTVNFIETSLQAQAVIGATPEQKVINSAKVNIVRLHDYKHGTSLAGSEADGSNGATTPNVVCASCHYSPALDLAHLGPNDDNGKEQTQHISMSRAMHGVHGSLPNKDPLYADLFPIMPPPGANRDPALAEGILQNTCYNCHPGKKAKCLRGAMGGSGTVCQDCHGQLTQVGDDFTEGFPQGGFPGGADLTKRVPWASEPACDSCHVGDVLQVAQLGNQLNDTIINPQDSHGNTDNLRLLMAYRLSDHKSNGGPDKLSLLKFPNSRFATTAALYRLSGANNGKNQGHEDLSCEGCHGSTHAIWPNKNPYSNDNKAANDIQGHAGPIIECSSCHEGDLGVTLEGPHGMHPVGNTKFSDGGHEDIAEKNGDACRACHGQNGEGTVLSRAAMDRTLSKEHGSVSVAKGEEITCTLCHDNKLK